MVKINLTQGAKLAGVGRSTLNRHIKEGKISKSIGDDGKPYVDTSELQRAYGVLSHDTSSQSVPMAQRGTPLETVEKAIETETLKVELQAVRDRLEEVQKDRDEWKGQAKVLSGLLTDQRQTPVQQTQSTETPITNSKGLLGRLIDAIKG